MRRLLRSALMIAACSLALGLASPRQAAAQLVLAMSPSTQNVLPGDTGFFTISLFNGTASAVALSAFNVTLTVPVSSGVTFTGGTEVGVPSYVFSGNSAGFFFVNPSGPNTADISDLADVGTATLAPNSTYNLGRVNFSVAPTAALGSVNVTLDAATALADATFTPLAYTPSGGNIIGLVNVVPEPSSLTMAAPVALIAAGAALRRRTRPRNGKPVAPRA